MTTDETKQIAVAIMELAAATAGKEIDEAVLAVYVKNLSAFGADAVVDALRRMILTAKFFPSVGEIAQAIGGNDALKAAEAWTNRFSADPVTAETVRLIGGARKIQLEPLDRLHFLERRFCELYPLVAAKMRDGQHDHAARIASTGGKLRRIGSAQ